MSTRTIAVLALSLALSAAACESLDPPQTAPDCPDPSVLGNPDKARVRGTVAFTPPEEPLDPDVHPSLTVRGTAYHEDGLAVRQVFVGGVAATPETFNFGQWSIELRYDTLVQLPPVEGGDGPNDRVEVAVTALDACGFEYPLTAFEVPVDLTPGVRVDRLSLVVELPPGRDYLPADGTTPAVVTVSANPKAAGAEIVLSATNGIFKGALDGRVTLSGDRQADASATVLYYPADPGLVLVTATAEGEIAAQTLQIAGPPALVPSAATLVPGQELQVLAFSDGAVHQCVAQPRPGVSVTSGGFDLMVEPAAVDDNGDGRYEIIVAVSPDLAEPTTVSVSCFDDYGQFALATFTVAVDP